MSWHTDPELLARYAGGRVAQAEAYSVEAHLPECPSCRASLAGLADWSGLDRVWEDVVDEVDRPRAGLLERALRSVGAPEHLARLLAATPSLRLSWALAVAVALGFAVMVARGTEIGTLAFLVVAPLVPVAGVAVAYGPAMDPAHEVGLASPIGGFRLLLIRAAAVLVASSALAGLAALGLPELGWTAAAWLLPSLALTVATLALSTAMSPGGATAVVGGAWVLGATAAERLAEERFAAFGFEAQVAFVAVAVGSLLLVAARREALELRRRV